MICKTLFLSVFTVLVSSVLAVANPINDLDKIAKANRYKEKAAEALENEDFELAISSYHYLLDSMGLNESEVLLNLAHCYYKTSKVDEASKLYQELVNDQSAVIRSVANQQLGVLQAQKQEFDPALEHLKEALKANPRNEGARYDYEVIKRMADQQKEQQEQENEDQENKEEQEKKENEEKNQEQKDQEQKDQEKQDQEKKDQQQGEQQEQNPDDQQQQDQQQQNKDQQQENQEQQQQDQQQKEGEEQKEQNEQDQKSEEQKKEEEKRKMQQQQQQRMQQINMSKEKAQMILDALKNHEVQYYQQMKRKAKPKGSDKPDW